MIAAARPAAPGRPRAGQEGYALILAALAVLFVSVIAAVIAHAAGTNQIGTVLEAQQQAAATIATAGAEWALATDMADGQTQTRTFGGGQFSVTRVGRTVRSTGSFGEANRVIAADRTLYYVPNSRFEGLDFVASFELVNRTGQDLDVNGITVEYAPSASYSAVGLHVFSEVPSPAFPGGAPAVDYRIVASFLSTGFDRFVSGQKVSFSPRRIGSGRQVLIDLILFSGSGFFSFVDMDPHPLRVTLHTAAGPLPGVAIPEVVR